MVIGLTWTRRCSGNNCRCIGIACSGEQWNAIHYSSWLQNVPQFLPAYMVDTVQDLVDKA